MKISPINNVQQPQFQGVLKSKGEWPYGLEETFLNCKAMQEFAEHSDCDIIGYLKTKKAFRNNKRHVKGQNLYKLMLKEDKKPTTLLGKIVDFFKPTKSLNRKYHSRYGISSILNSVTERYITKRIK